jgi:predicted PurR-regulated permease PerM
LLGYLLSGIVAELEQSKKLFMQTYDNLVHSWNSWASKLTRFHSDVDATGDEISKVKIVGNSPISGEMSGTIMHGVSGAATVVTFSLLVPILTFFLLAERDGFARILARGYQAPQHPKLIWSKIVKSTRAFFLGNLVLGLITYPLFVLLFLVFSTPSLFATAAIASVVNLVPFAGAVLSGLLPALVLYTQTQNHVAPLFLYGCCVFIHFIIADFVTPKILGSQVNINATTSTLALVVWGELWGGIGLILAIPLTSMLKILLETSGLFWLQWIAALMSEDIDTALRVPSFSETRKASQLK